MNTKSGEEKYNLEYKILETPKDLYWLHIGGDARFALSKRPNRFWRLMQYLILGFIWGKIGDN